jgi:hypothetical protein
VVEEAEVSIYMPLNADFAPWGDITPLVPAGDACVLLNGFPSRVPVRVLSEENYQFAVAAINELHRRGLIIVQEAHYG